MHSSASSDKSSASCVICAKEIPDRAQVCPYCGEGPFLEDDADDEAWSAEEAAEDAASDPVLEAMMAIASATPKAAHAESVPIVLLSPAEPNSASSLPDPGDALSQPATMPLHAGAASAASSPARRWVFGTVAVTMLATLTGAQLQWNDDTAAPRREAANRMTSTAAEALPAPGDRPSDIARELPKAADPAPPTAAPPEVRAVDRAADVAQASAIATVPRERREVRSPAEPPPAPVVEAPPAPPVATQPSGCSEALLALALCREPQ